MESYNTVVDKDVITPWWVQPITPLHGNPAGFLSKTIHRRCNHALRKILVAHLPGNPAAVGLVQKNKLRILLKPQH